MTGTAPTDDVVSSRGTRSRGRLAVSIVVSVVVVLIIFVITLIGLLNQLDSWVAAILQTAAAVLGAVVGILLDRALRRSNDAEREANLEARARASIRRLLDLGQTLTSIRQQVEIRRDRVLSGEFKGGVPQAVVVDWLEFTASGTYAATDSIGTDVGNWDDIAPGTSVREITAFTERKASIASTRTDGITS